MFCPVCRAEYRPGFTECPDCEEKLVYSLPDDDSPDLGAPAATDQDGSVLLWAGTDQGTADSITAALRHAGVEFDESAAESVLLPATRNQILEVRVHGSDLDSARKAVSAYLDDANGEEISETPSATLTKAASFANPFHFQHPILNHVPGAANGSESEDDAEPAEDDYVEDFDPEEATVLLWSGSDSKMAQYFKDCLSNVGIGCVLDADTGSIKVFVMPSAEKRAKEVVREIQEGSPLA